MAVTQSQSMHPASIRNVAHGSYITDGTAAAFTITTGFKPRYVIVVNTNASGDVAMEWFEGMTAAYGVKTSIAGARSLITSLGITVSSSGFTVGLDTDLNVTNEQLHWQAIG